jgi:predicted Fe-Mo cluster-binding NifX family protein
MKIAAATDDGHTIALDLESAAYYVVYTVDAGLIVGLELREKRPRGWYQATGHAEHRGPSGAIPEAVHGHDMLTDPIRDCQVLLASGVEPATRGRLEAAEIWPIIVDPGPIETALQAFMAGLLVSG